MAAVIGHILLESKPIGSIDDHNWLWLWLQPDQHEANQYGGAIARTIVIVTVVVQETHIASETLLKDLGIAF